jgi:MFS transporter, MCT family, solute carrier family 16 (monocarboxylic acid transporters), member 3
MGMGNAGWTAGYLLGTPIAGYLLNATSDGDDHSIEAYRPLIFYAAGTATVALLVVLVARVRISVSMFARV